MMGMPRMTFTTVLLVQTKGATPETRINAQTKPSSVESASEPMVTMMVSFTPRRRIGRNSPASWRKALMVR